MSLIRKPPTGALLKDVLKGLKHQGVADEDLIAGITKAGISDDMARAMLLRVTEDVEATCPSTQKSITRIEIDSSLSKWGKTFELKNNEKLETVSVDIEGLKATLRRISGDQERCIKELEILKISMKELNTSVKSFEIYAKEILKALKK